MPTVLKILHLEDVASDAELVERALRKAGLSCTITRVDNRAAFVKALAEINPDIVLIDYKLPDFDGLSALKIVRERDPDLPTVVVTGVLSNEAALELVMAGANDYVLKDNLARLGFAVERTLLMASTTRARQQAVLALRQSEERYRSLVEDSNDAILTEDLDGTIISWNTAAERIFGYTKSEAITRKASFYTPDEIRSQLAQVFDKIRKGEYVAPFESERIHKDGHRVTVTLTMSPIRDNNGRLIGVSIIARDLTERHVFLNKLSQNLEQTISAIAATIAKRDPYTASHQTRVAQLAPAIATEMGLPPERIRALRLAATIHDIGKIGIPAEILSRPGRLSEAEMSLIRTHSQIGYDIICGIEFPWPVATMVLQHHERLDGSGYPAKLSAEAIIPEARILAVADVVEAMNSHRPYRPALGIDVALKEIMDNRGQLYDAAAVDVCVSLFRQKGFSFK